MYFFGYAVIFTFDFIDFVKIDNKWCKTNLNEQDVQYNTLEEAKNACFNDKKCKLLYDVQSKNETFIICGTAVTQKSNNEGSSLYMKCR